MPRDGRHHHGCGVRQQNRDGEGVRASGPGPRGPNDWNNAVWDSVTDEGVRCHFIDEAIVKVQVMCYNQY